MDDKISRLIKQLKQDFDLTDAELTDLIAAVKAEALAEAKITLKNLLVQNILSQALAQPEKLLDLDQNTRNSNPPQPPPMPLIDGERQRRQEIIAIRQQLAENEQLLKETTTPSPPTVTGTPFLEADAFIPLDKKTEA